MERVAETKPARIPPSGPIDQEDPDLSATLLYNLCLDGFKIVSSSLHRRKNVKEHEKLADIGVQFRLWGGIVDGQRLEHALTFSPELDKSVVELLASIGGSLLQLSRSTIELDRQTVYSSLNELRDAVVQITAQASDSVDLEPVALTHRPDDLGTLQKSTGVSESKEGQDNIETAPDILEDLEFDVSMLLDLLPTIEQLFQSTLNPSQKVLTGKAPVFHVTHHAHAYVRQVRDKFQNAPIVLAERLGEANWQRHCILRQQEDEEATHELEQARSVFKPASAFHDSAIGSSIAQTPQRPMSVASYGSFASELTENGSHHNRVPREPPEVALQEPFKCKFCGTLVKNVRNRSEYKRHVFADLNPYICTSSDCSAALATYHTRAAWAEHEFTHHRSTTVYCCRLCQSEFKGKEDCLAHLQDQHGDYAKQHIDIHIQARGESDISVEACPLCLDTGFKSKKQFVSHVCRHMEEIALSVILHDSASETETDGPGYDTALECSDQGDAIGSPLIPHLAAQDEDWSTERLLGSPQFWSAEDYDGGAYSKLDSASKPSGASVDQDKDTTLDFADPTSSNASVEKHPARYQCNFCPISYSRKDHFQHHLRTHIGKRRFVCTACGIAFGRQTDYRSHQPFCKAREKFL